MKMILLLLFIITSLHLRAQTTKSYYDYLWRPCEPELARFYSEVTKTDSGWLRHDFFLGTKTLQMSGLYEDKNSKIENGYFKYYYSNGAPEKFGKSIHNKYEGLWLEFYPTGAMKDSTNYRDGKPMGISLGWHANGFIADSITNGTDGTDVEVQWFTNGNPSSAGHYTNGKLNGPWQFFHNNGKLAASEYYNLGALEKGIYYDTSGNQIKKPVPDRQAEFPGGKKDWAKFVYKHIYFPPQYRINNSDQVTVVVQAAIDENGNVTDPFVVVPFDPAFDKIALEIFKKSPKWLPAIQHNRSVLQIVRQPVTFSQE